ncbi:hypothetical protein ACN082_06170 [Rothia sp. CCM 9417]|uniref:hypothetical protein n=1 Tax=unclassified Rothia (in: high G+C Gram-positive bacteria) TaxID=2689056 RepID=UPI003AD5506E
MAEHVHQVPEKYGQVRAIYHPRIHSYHRRLIAGVPSTVLALACIWFMLTKRPTPIVMVILVFIALGAICAIYSVLRPQIIVKTNSHILRGKLVGWETVPLADIEHTVLAERLTPKQASGKELKGIAALRFKGAPALWALNSKQKRIFRLDGRIWDAKTMRAIATAISPQTTVYKVINVTQMKTQHPGLVTFNELHPGWKSTVLGAISLAFLIALAVAAFLPEETLQQFSIL